MNQGINQCKVFGKGKIWQIHLGFRDNNLFQILKGLETGALKGKMTATMEKIASLYRVS